MNNDLKSIKLKKRNFIIGLISFAFGVIFMILLYEIVLKPKKSDSYSFIPVAASQAKVKDGGVASRGVSETFTSAYYSYLRTKEPIETEFNKRFTAATWYSMSELENFFKSIKDDTNLESEQIRVYVCPTVYPAGTINPYNHKDVSNRITSSLAFFKSPSTIFKPGTSELHFKGNPNCLGVYNWGDLEP